ncbi:MAG: hypothetical protein EG826_18540 [Deltaproteobacteria bacterium]|nr:hypothetical protein [Deltaproteobacteria bacterium]
MRVPGTIFQSISLRRRVVISIGMLIILIVVIGFYGLMAILESNKRLHKSVVEAQAMASAIDTARLSQVHFKKQVQEWKDILLRGSDKALFEKHLKAFGEEERKVNKCLESLTRMTAGAGLFVPQITDAIDVHEKLGRRYREALAGHKQIDLKTSAMIDKGVRGIDRDLTDKIDQLVAAIKTLTEKNLKDTEKIAQTQMEAYLALSFFIVFLMIAGVLFGIHNARSIIRELPSREKTGAADRT